MSAQDGIWILQETDIYHGEETNLNSIRLVLQASGEKYPQISPQFS